MRLLPHAPIKEETAQQISETAMAFFKSNPEKTVQRDIDAAKVTLDRLSARLLDTDQAIVQHTAAAQKLALDGDDAGLDRAEASLRAAQDRRSTLKAAATQLEQQLSVLEQTKAENADRKLRAETAAVVELLAREVIDAAAAFDATAAALADCTARAAPIVFEATGVQHFALIARAEIPAAGDMIAALLRTHASAVLDGSGPAVLPTSEPPFVEPVKEKPPPTVRLFAMRPIKWRDASGQQRSAQKFTDADLTESAAARGLASGACVRLSDPLRKQHHGTAPGPVRVDLAFDLDNEASADETTHAPAETELHSAF